MCQYSSIVCKFLIIQSGQTKCPTPALSRVTPNNVLGLPWYIVRGYPIQCLHTAPGNVGTMFLHCPGQCGDIVSALPLIWGTMWRHCNRTAPHLGGSAETLYPHCPGQYGDNISVVPLALQRYYMEYPLTMYRGSPETLLGITWDNAGVACFVFPDWIGNHTFRSHSNAFLFPTEWRKEWESFKLEWINTTRSARLPTSTPLGLLRHFPVLGSVTLT